VYPPSPRVSRLLRRSCQPSLVSTASANGRTHVCALLIAALVGCGTPTKEEEMQTGQAALVDEATELQHCFNTNGYASDKCADQRKAYEGDLAKFRSTYAK
jgi:hypothetical protein